MNLFSMESAKDSQTFNKWMLMNPVESRIIDSDADIIDVKIRTYIDSNTYK